MGKPFPSKQTIRRCGSGATESGSVRCTRSRSPAIRSGEIVARRIKTTIAADEPIMGNAPVEEKFHQAVGALVEQTKEDRSILAAILCGSLSHDTVWAKSDIDLVLVTVDDGKLASDGIALYADGINVHAILIPRSEFRRTVEGSVQNSFIHSFLTKGRLLFTHDETIA